MAQRCLTDWLTRDGYLKRQTFQCAQGVDISKSMLDVALEREVDGDVCLADMGHGLPFRVGTFDGAISISAVQWLCNAV